MCVVCLSIVALYDNGMQVEVTDYELIYDNSKLGEQTVIVRFEGQETSFDIPSGRPRKGLYTGRDPRQCGR